ncbi:MAG: hypothetical protein JWN14_900 [Chthonomonadales bacterium]|nr:hypothetical protein [Chthonomonadales bacterium]
MICRNCARGSKNLLHQVTPGRYLLAVIACLAASIFGGWLIASYVTGYGFMGLWVAFLFGYGIGEIALRITGRKRGLAMEALAGASTAFGVISGVAINLLLILSSDPSTTDPHLIGNHLIGNPLTNPMTYVTLILAVVSAVGRIRNI